VLEAKFAETVAEQPELLAHHYTEAGDAARAVGYWERAGQRALAGCATAEAIRHLARGLELLATLPEGPARDEQELKLQIPFGASMLMTKGYGAREVKDAYSRARELSDRGANPAEVFPLLFGLWRSYVVEARLQANREIAEQLLAVARRADDRALLVVAEYALGATLCFLGEWATARTHLEVGRSLYDPHQRRLGPSLSATHDPGIACLAYLARALWHLGLPDAALAVSRESVAHARTLAHPFTLAFALTFASRLHQLRRDTEAARALAEEAITLSVERGFPHWIALGTILRGWAGAVGGGGAAAVGEMKRGIEAWRATGTALSQSHWLGLLAEGYRKAGRFTEASTALAEALDLVEQTGERWWEAELHRLRGELLVDAGGGAGHGEPTPEGCFRRALEIARRQGARSLELRAAVSLARWWRGQGRPDEARALLCPVYDTFTEGFDTADLREARALAG
jgi:predicted ATPase